MGYKYEIAVNRSDIDRAVQRDSVPLEFIYIASLTIRIASRCFSETEPDP